MRVWSLTPFAWEVPEYEVRLAELDGVVDVHVVAEAPIDYMGHPKPLCFSSVRTGHVNAEIRRLIVDDETDGAPEVAGPWGLEYRQRRALARGLDGIQDDDVVFLSDADEIPDADGLETAVAAALTNAGTTRVLMPMYLYSLRWRWPDMSWGYQIARVARWRHIRETYGGDIQAWRKEADGGSPTLPMVMTRGWHMAYFGGLDRVKRKLAGHAHPEMGIPEHEDDAWVAESITSGRDLFNRAYRPTISVPERDWPASARELGLHVLTDDRVTA